MPTTLTFKISYKKNEGIVLSASELKDLYLSGIPLCTPDGSVISNEAIKQKIAAAQEWLEKFLAIKLNLQVITEPADFIKNDYNSWGFLNVNYPIRDALSLEGFLNTVRQIVYPVEWCSIARYSDENLFLRTLHIVPAGTLTSTTTTNSVIFAGVLPLLGYQGLSSIPNFWTLKYVTGFKKIPEILTDFIGKMAAIQLLGMAGDIVLGIGISSESLSLDGLSQSRSSSRSANSSIFSARIKQYGDELARDFKMLKDYYKGITFGVL